MPTVHDLDRTAESVDLDQLARFRALAAGGEAFDAMKQTFLPRLSAEEADAYGDRMRRSCYTNVAGPLIDLIASWLLKDPPRVNDAPARLAHLEWDVNGAGGALDDALRTALSDLLIDRRIYVWADLPPASDASSLLEQEAAGLLLPRLHFFSGSSVRNYGTDDRGKLRWLVHAEEFIDQDGPLSPKVRRRRWRVIDQDAVATYEWSASEDEEAAFANGPWPKDPARLLSRVEHGLGQIPVFAYELPEPLWAMRKLYDPARRALLAENDNDWALHRAAHAVLLLIKPDMTKHFEEGGDVVVGPGAAHEVPNGGDARWLEPSGTSFAALRQQRLDSERAVYRVLHQMAVSLPESTRQVASSGAKSQDWDAMRIVMSAYAGVLRLIVHGAYSIAAAVARVDDWTPQVRGGMGWEARELSDFLSDGILTVGAQAMSPTFAREVAKISAQKLLAELVSDDVMAAIFAEIDDAPPLGNNILLAGKQLGDDVFTATGARDAVEQAAAERAGETGETGEDAP